jgi:hypothetical protein
MTKSNEALNQEVNQKEVPQYGLGMILLMFAWPAAWFTFLIYIAGKQFIPTGGVTPTWVLLSSIVLGTGAGTFLSSSHLRPSTFWQLPDMSFWAG